MGANSKPEVLTGYKELLSRLSVKAVLFPSLSIS